MDKKLYSLEESLKFLKHKVEDDNTQTSEQMEILEFFSDYVISDEWSGGVEGFVNRLHELSADIEFDSRIKKRK